MQLRGNLYQRIGRYCLQITSCSDPKLHVIACCNDKIYSLTGSKHTILATSDKEKGQIYCSFFESDEQELE